MSLASDRFNWKYRLVFLRGSAGAVTNHIRKSLFVSQCLFIQNNNTTTSPCKTQPTLDLMFQCVLETWCTELRRELQGPTKAWSEKASPPKQMKVVDQPWEKLFISLFLGLVMSVFWPELPGVLVCSLHVVSADITQDFLQINLEEEKIQIRGDG